jgi:exonuclease SbcD
MVVARFLQVSDFHLGRPFGWLPAERRADRRRDQRYALELAVREAIERGAHAILIPGDLFDLEGVDADTLAFALHAFAVSGCPPVFIAPGNHDPYFPASAYWNERLLRGRGLAWPAHVHIFDSAGWTARPVPGLAGVRVLGRCFTASVACAERPLEARALEGVGSPDPAGFDLALFHGSHEDGCPPGQEVTAPFSEDEVLGAPFAYLAAGHYHATSRIEADGGASAGVRLAYAGSAVALDGTETGAHGALEVRIEYGHRLPHVESEFVELDRRRVYDLAAEVGGAGSAEQVDHRVQKAMDEAGVSDQDIATVRLSGRLVKGVRYGGPGPELKARTFHLRVDLSRVRPDYDLDAYRGEEARTTEERFARALLQRLDAESDPAQRAVLTSALYYGLDAFRLREVVPAYEELGE